METSEAFPIAIFAYKRLEHLRQSLEALAKNALASQSCVTIFSDGPKSSADAAAVEEVRQYCANVSGFRSVKVINSPRNKGLARSVVEGVSQLLEHSLAVIVLEDDIVTGPQFLTYMNNCLRHFANDARIFSVTGFHLPFAMPSQYAADIYLSYRSSSWGWGTWADRWRQVDWDVADFQEFMKNSADQKKFNRGGEDLTPMLQATMAKTIDSWAVKWCYAHFRHNAYCVCPRTSLVFNIGNDGSGTHCGPTDAYGASHLPTHFLPKIPAHVSPDAKILRRYQAFYSRRLWDRVRRRLTRIFS